MYGGVDVRIGVAGWLVASIVVLLSGGCGWSASTPGQSPYVLPQAYPGVAHIALSTSQSLLQGQIVGITATDQDWAMLVKWTNVPFSAALWRMIPDTGNLVEIPGPKVAKAYVLSPQGLAWIGANETWHLGPNRVRLQADTTGVWQVFWLGNSTWAAVEQYQPARWQYWILSRNAIIQSGTQVGKLVGLVSQSRREWLAAVANPNRIVLIHRGGATATTRLPGTPVQLGYSQGETVCLISTSTSEPTLANLLWQKNIKASDAHTTQIPPAWTPTAARITPWVGGATNFYWSKSHSVVVSLWDPAANEVALATWNLSRGSWHVMPNSVFHASLAQNQAPYFPLANGPDNSVVVANGLGLAWYLPTKPSLSF